MAKEQKLEGKFSVGLGLLDYINPLTYLINNIIIAYHIKNEIDEVAFMIYIVGVTISLAFGFTIPTVKVLVGLGKMQFALPVNLVTYVNCGIFISGSTLILSLMKLNPWVYLAIIAVCGIFLYGIYQKKKRFNTIAVLIGCIGYVLIYTTNIVRAAGLGLVVPIVCYCIAIAVTCFLIYIVAFANLLSAKIHWVIESSNITGQILVVIGTIILYCR